MIVLVASILGSGCAAVRPSNPTLTFRYEKAWQRADVDAYVARAGDRDVALFDLGATSWVSHHLAVVRTAETPHYHRFHDMTVVVLRGRGMLHVDGRIVPMKVGDVAHVHRGAPHMFVNESREPAAALVVFSPAFDGRDRVSVETRSPVGAAEKPWWRLF